MWSNEEIPCIASIHGSLDAPEETIMDLQKKILHLIPKCKWKNSSLFTAINDIDRGTIALPPTAIYGRYNTSPDEIYVRNYSVLPNITLLEDGIAKKDGTMEERIHVYEKTFHCVFYPLIYPKAEQ